MMFNTKTVFAVLALLATGATALPASEVQAAARSVRSAPVARAEGRHAATFETKHNNVGRRAVTFETDHPVVAVRSIKIGGQEIHGIAKRQAAIDAIKAGTAAAEEVDKIAHEIADLAGKMGDDDRNARSQWVEGLINIASNQYPDKNVFCYHQFQDNFEYQIDDQNPITLQYTWKRKDVPDTTEYYNVVIFSGAGWLVNKGDGGWVNWGQSGNYEKDGNNVKFH